MKTFKSKLFLLSLMVAGGTLLLSCAQKEGQRPVQGFAGTAQEESTDGNAQEAPAEESKPQWQVDGNTLTYGQHTYTMEGNMDKEYVANAKAKVTFTNVPSDYEEFLTVYEQLLGKTSYGVSAMLPMAFELWGRDHELGKQCIALITGGTCYNEIMRQLPAHMELSSQSPADDPYVQRCLPAAVLEGATKENGYNPTEPYTVNMVIGRKAQWGEESEVLQANVYQLSILSGNAWHTPQRGVTVMLPWRGEQLYRVNACSSLYVNIFAPRQDWNGLK